MKKKELKAQNNKLLEERKLLGNSLKILAETLGRSCQKSKTLKEMYLGILDVKDALEKRVASLEKENLKLKDEVKISKNLLEQAWYKETSVETPKEDSETLARIKKEIQELFNTKETFETALRDIYHKAQDGLGISQR
jgi:hypothetical protein